MIYLDILSTNRMRDVICHPDRTRRSAVAIVADQECSSEIGKHCHKALLVDVEKSTPTNSNFLSKRK